MNHFTPVSGLLGGLLIGTSAVLLLYTLGRLAGISNMAHAALAGPGKGESTAQWAWRPVFLLGLVLGGSAYAYWGGHAVTARTSVSPAVLVLAGLLVGWGTAQGNGCTSGHGVCGLARLSLRSLVATLTFMFTGGLAVFVARHLWHLV